MPDHRRCFLKRKQLSQAFDQPADGIKVKLVLPAEIVKDLRFRHPGFRVTVVMDQLDVPKSFGFLFYRNSSYKHCNYIIPYTCLNVKENIRKSCDYIILSFTTCPIR